MSLKRLFQVVAKEELQAGSAAASLYDAANANFLVIDPTLEFNPEQFDRANINRASLSPFSPLAGVVTGTCTFQLELAGTGAATTPPFGLLLEACGMEQADTSQVTIGAITVGSELAFYNGETVTESGAGSETGTVVHDTYNGETTLLVRGISGAFTSGSVLTGSTSLSVATTSSITTAFGISWTPDSIELLTLGHSAVGGTNETGDVIIGPTSGAIAILQADDGASPGTVSVRVLDGIFIHAEVAVNQTQTGTITVDTATTLQSNVPAISLGVIEDGPAKALLGTRGTFSLGGNIGEAMLFSFEFLGLKNAVTDEGTVTGVTYTTQVPPVMLGVTFDIWDDDRAIAGTPTGTYSPRFSSLSFDYANTMGIGRDAGESTGVYGSAHITSRNTSGNMSIDVAPEGAFAFIEAVSAGTPTHMKLQVGSTVGNKFIVSCPSAVFTGEGGGDTEGIATRDLPFRVGSRHPDGTDADDCELVITYQHTT